MAGERGGRSPLGARGEAPHGGRTDSHRASVTMASSAWPEGRRMTESEAGRQPGPGQEWRLWTLSRVDSGGAGRTPGARFGDRRAAEGIERRHPRGGDD